MKKMITILCLATMSSAAFAVTRASNSFKINQGTYSYYSSDDILKCFEVLEQPSDESKEIPIRAVLMKSNCPSEAICSPIEQFGRIILSNATLTFVLDNGFAARLDSIFMRAGAIYGDRNGKNEVYFFLPSIKCSP